MVVKIPDDVSGLIYDLDGTLIDSMPVHYQAYNAGLEPYNVVYPKEVFLSRAGIPTIDTLKMIERDYQIPNFNIEEVLERKRKYLKDNLERVKLIDPVFDIVKQYHKVLPMSIGTGSHRSMVDRVVSQLGINKYIDIVVTADDVKRHKPYPDTFLKCADLMKIDPKECLVFEDGVPGIKAAEEAGMKVIDVREFLPTVLD